MQELDRKEKFLISNTLNCIPFLLKGQAVLIDLRNDCSVAGRIDTADGHMNIHLVDVVFINRLGQQFPFEQFMVKERIIRQIHIPEHIDMAEKIKNWCNNGCMRRTPREVDGKKGKRTFKQKRAQEKHKEILKELEQKQQENRQ